jgi:hypothetical protein
VYVVAVSAGMGVLACLVSVLLMSHRGFDLTDEGFYLLSYRWWRLDLRNFTGAQYLYGPVFGLLGHSVPALRVFRFLTLIICHVVFGRTFMRWLGLRSPRAADGWPAAGGTAAITASGCVSFGWLPLSPGYNDLALMGAMLLAAWYLHLQVAVETERKPSVVAALTLGPVVFSLLLAKWTSGILLVAFLCVFVVTSPRLVRSVISPRFAGLMCLGALGVLVGFDLLVPLGQALRGLLAVNKMVAASTNSPLDLIDMYVKTGATLGRLGLPLLIVVIAFAVLAWFLIRLGRKRAGIAIGAVGPVIGMGAYAPQTSGFVVGGVAHVETYSAVLLALSIVACGAGLFPYLASRRCRTARKDAATGRVWAFLILLPLVQGMGTGNPLYLTAVNAFACWFALVIAAITMSPPSTLARVLASSAGVCACLTAVSVGVTGTLLYPYRTSGFFDATTRIGGPGPVAQLLVDPRTASGYASIRRAIGPTQTGGRPIMAFDEMAGLVLALGGQPVGEPWYSGLDHRRTANGIEAACRAGNPWAPQRQPILIIDRAPLSVDKQALDACGLRLDRDFHRIPTTNDLRRVIIYLPTEHQREKPS